jgi:hypothetical protein
MDAPRSIAASIPAPQCRSRRGGDGSSRFGSSDSAEHLEEVTPPTKQNVINPTLAQSRQPELNHIEPVKQVFPKLIGRR